MVPFSSFSCRVRTPSSANAQKENFVNGGISTVWNVCEYEFGRGSGRVDALPERAD
jgi:hypothetical protein